MQLANPIGGYSLGAFDIITSLDESSDKRQASEKALGPFIKAEKETPMPLNFIDETRHETAFLAKMGIQMPRLSQISQPKKRRL